MPSSFWLRMGGARDYGNHGVSFAQAAGRHGTTGGWRALQLPRPAARTRHTGCRGVHRTVPISKGARMEWGLWRRCGPSRPRGRGRGSLGRRLASRTSHKATSQLSGVQQNGHLNFLASTGFFTVITRALLLRLPMLAARFGLEARKWQWGKLRSIRPAEHIRKRQTCGGPRPLGTPAKRGARRLLLGAKSAACREPSTGRGAGAPAPGLSLGPLAPPPAPVGVAAELGWGVGRGAERGAARGGAVVGKLGSPAPQRDVVPQE